MIEADSSEAESGFLLASGFGDDDDGSGRVEDGARPGCVLAAEADVDAAGEMAFCVLGCVADIENLRTCVAHSENPIEINRLEDLLERCVECGPLASVEDGVEGEVCGSIGADRL